MACVVHYYSNQALQARRRTWMGKDDIGHDREL